METQENNQSAWLKFWTESVTIKGLVIGFLTLVLLVPSAMIASLIEERASLRSETIAEVSAKWAGQQLINGPVLTIPVVFREDDAGAAVHTTHYWNILPNTLSIVGAVTPQDLNRGIYHVPVFSSSIRFQGAFELPDDLPKDKSFEIQYDRAFLTIGISDLRGIRENVNIQWDDNSLDVSPGTKIPHVIQTGITAPLPDLSQMAEAAHSFDFTLQVQGSQNLSFVPLGKTTITHLSSTWPSPGFDGSFLPDQRAVSDQGFEADWKVLELNRNFPQSWVGKDNTYAFDQAAFGVNFVQTVDDYQKSARSIKYAVMTIALTFLVFFLVEIRHKRLIHPFQYVLVGLALSLFYILLVAISEHTTFDVAYALSFTGIFLMVCLYARRLFKSMRMTAILSGCLVVIYGFIFVTLQLEDYALLMGSIGLALILAMTMYFTRNIDWYRIKLNADQSQVA